jgi:DNA mismatch endonuclease, patch repair protein
VRSSGTAAEQRLASFLSAQKLRFTLNVRDLPGCPDVVFRRRKVAVFVNGCFWHGHSGCSRAKLPTTNADRWRTKIHTNKSRDRRVAGELRAAGWSVLTVWECSLGEKGLALFYTRLSRALARERK